MDDRLKNLYFDVGDIVVVNDKPCKIITCYIRHNNLYACSVKFANGDLETIRTLDVSEATKEQEDKYYLSKYKDES